MACTALLCTFVLSPGSSEGKKNPRVPSEAFVLLTYVCACTRARSPWIRKSGERQEGGREEEPWMCCEITKER